MLGALFCGSGRVSIRGDGDFDFSTLLQAHLIAVFIDQSVFDAELAVEIFGALHGNLGLFRFAWKNGRDDLFNRPGRVTTALSVFSGLSFADSWLIERSILMGKLYC